MQDKVDLKEKFRLFDEHWSPRIVGELNGQYVKLAKIEGEFTWHAHTDEDELFLVVEGRMTLRLRDRDVDLEAGQFFIVPAGVEHLPIAHGECHVLLFEPKATSHTGATQTDLTVAIEDQAWI